MSKKDKAKRRILHPYEQDRKTDWRILGIFFLALAVFLIYTINMPSNIFGLLFALVLLFVPAFVLEVFATRKAKENSKRIHDSERRDNFSIEEVIENTDDDLSFRKIEIEQLESLRGLANCDDEKWQKLTAARQESLMKEYSEIYIVEKNGQIVAEVTVYCTSRLLSQEAAFGRRAYFEGLRVLPEFRRQHIAQRLMQFVINEYKNRGYYEFTIGVEEDNVPALNLYKKLNFTKKIAHGKGDEFDPCEYDLYLRRDTAKDLPQ